MLHRRLLVPLAVVPFAVGAVLTGTASAAPAQTVTAGIGGLATAPDSTAAVANVGIVKTAGRAHWTKSYISGRRTANASNCTAATAAFTITNNLAVAQAVRANGQFFERIPANHRSFVCGSGSRAFSVTLTLGSNTNAKLVAHFS